MSIFTQPVQTHLFSRALCTAMIIIGMCSACEHAHEPVAVSSSLAALLEPVAVGQPLYSVAPASAL